MMEYQKHKLLLLQALTKYEKSKQCLDSSEIHYRSAASATEECRRLWESETENSLAGDILREKLSAITFY